MIDGNPAGDASRAAFGETHHVAQFRSCGGKHDVGKEMQCASGHAFLTNVHDGNALLGLNKCFAGLLHKCPKQTEAGLAAAGFLMQNCSENCDGSSRKRMEAMATLVMAKPVLEHKKAKAFAKEMVTDDDASTSAPFSGCLFAS